MLYLWQFVPDRQRAFQKIWLQLERLLKGASCNELSQP
jgi:hypothetical protein